MTKRRILLLTLSPILLTLALIALVIGFAYAGGSNPAETISSSLSVDDPTVSQLTEYSLRCLLFPFQLLFIGLILGFALLLYRRRWRIAERVLGPLPVETEPEKYNVRFDPLHDDWEQMVKVKPQRHLTLTHLIASLIAILAIAIATTLILSQFIGLTDLAIIVTALTSALAWGARLPVSDVLGGISNLLENNFNVGDKISYRNFSLDVEGIVEEVNLRFTWLRADPGELVTIPLGEIRTMRNFSRSTFAGVYVSFPIPSQALESTIQHLESLAPQSPELIPDLLEPWRVMSKDGALRETVELSLYGRAPVGREEELQLSIHTLVWEELQASNLIDSGEKG
ncbi:MAG: mechanosensitive ion channel [Chloroflexota bacterium]